MNTNLSSKDKEISEINKNRSEITWNRVDSVNTIMLLIIAVSNVFINLNLNSVNQKLEDAKFFETTIDHLASNAENREIALSMLYSLYILEEKLPKHRDMLIDVSETILETNLTSQEKNIPISQKALKIIKALDAEKAKEVESKIAQTPGSKTDPNPNISEQSKSIDKSDLKKIMLL